MPLIAYIAIAALVACIGFLIVALGFRRGRVSVGTPENIAYALLFLVARAEEKSLGTASDGEPADRKWILDAFAECMQAVKTPDKRLESPASNSAP